MIEFSNPSKLLENGKCCDNNVGKGCGDCDIRFERCLSDENPIKEFLDCNIERHASKEYEDTNVLKKFDRHIFDGMVIVKSHRAWKGYVMFMIDIFDVDFIGLELINHFNTTNYLFAAPNATSAVEMEMPELRGPQGSSLRYSFKVYCDKYYYGLSCSKYCREDEPENQGNFRCTKRGDKVCKDGYIWPECTEKVPTTAPPATAPTTMATTTKHATSTPDHRCGGTVQGSTGKISVYGRDFYGYSKAHALIRCSWKIVFPKDQKTRLYFTEYNLSKPLRCVDSVVTIDLLGNVLTFYCSEIPPGYGEVRVKESFVEVHAVVALDQWGPDNGFTIKYEPF